MKVKLLTYICSGDIPAEAFHAAALIKKIYSLFDIFNGSSLLDSKLFTCAQREDSPSLDYIKMMRCSFNHLAYNVGKCPPMPCSFYGTNCKHYHIMEYNLCTRNINQDPLENCFSVIRSKGGLRDNPTSKLFAAAYKQILIKRCMT